MEQGMGNRSELVEVRKMYRYLVTGKNLDEMEEEDKVRSGCTLYGSSHCFDPC